MLWHFCLGHLDVALVLKCDSFTGGNAAKQTSLDKLALPDNHIMSSMGWREHRKESRPHKMALMGLV